MVDEKGWMIRFAKDGWMNRMMNVVIDTDGKDQNIIRENFRSTCDDSNGSN